VHTDVVTASAEAYVDAINRLFQARDAHASDEEDVLGIGVAVEVTA
jgi:hypothetical protein